MELTHFSLFTGIGGIDLSAEWVGFKTIGQCEQADYPTKVLEKYWPNVPRWRDIRDVTNESVRVAGIERISLLSGGFPCQPFSNAGKRRSKEDDRYLWPEMLRVIQELRPTWVIGENVTGIINLALDTVLFELENIGYSTQAFVIPACAVNAPHRRERVFIVAYSNSIGCIYRQVEQHSAETGEYAQRDATASSKDVANAEGGRVKKQFTGRTEAWGFSGSGWWATEPELGRVANGIPAKLYGGGLDEASSSQEGIAENVRFNRQNMREMRDGKEFTETSPKHNQPQKDSNIVPEVPQRGTSEKRNLGTGEQADGGLYSLREKISSQGFTPAQDLWGRLPENLRKDACEQKMASWWENEPDIPRVVNGVKNRVDRLKCLGNAVVPQQVYPILKAIYEIERCNQ